MLTCRELTQLVTDYIEGRLGFWESARFRLHLGMCRQCSEYVRQLRLTRDTLGVIPPLELPEEIEAELLRQFREWKQDAPGAGGPSDDA